MKKYEDEKKELRECGIEEPLLDQLDSLVSLDKYRGHMKAKHELTAMGKEALPVLHDLMKCNSDIIRKESAKIIHSIGSKDSLHVAVEMLEDPVWEIRWIAAEILIKVGRRSLHPLLRALIENHHSFALREGTHHVLSELMLADDPDALEELQHILINSEYEAEIPIKASEVLRTEIDLE